MRNILLTNAVIPSRKVEPPKVVSYLNNPDGEELNTWVIAKNNPDDTLRSFVNEVETFIDSLPAERAKTVTVNVNKVLTTASIIVYCTATNERGSREVTHTVEITRETYMDNYGSFDNFAKSLIAIFGRRVDLLG